MRTSRSAGDLSGDALAPRCDALLLARLGRELATVYRDVLDAPTPPALRRLTDRLDESAGGPRRGASAGADER